MTVKKVNKVQMESGGVGVCVCVCVREPVLMSQVEKD